MGLFSLLQRGSCTHIACGIDRSIEYSIFCSSVSDDSCACWRLIWVISMFLNVRLFGVVSLPTEVLFSDGRGILVVSELLRHFNIFDL